MTNSLEQIVEQVRAEHRATLRRPPIAVEYQGEPMSLRELAQRTGVPHSTLTHRYRQGIRGADLLAPPKNKGGRKRAA